MCYLTQITYSTATGFFNEVIHITEVRNHLLRLFEENDITENYLLELYCDIKPDQYYNSNVFDDSEEYKYLNIYSILLKNMMNLMIKRKMSKEFIKRIKHLFYNYSVWSILMRRIQDWDKTENVLTKEMFFKRSFEKITKSYFIKNICRNKYLSVDMFIKLFEEYSEKKIIFPIFHKYFWKKT